MEPKALSAIRKARRQRNPSPHSAVCVTAGGTKISIPRAIREDANLERRVVLYHDPEARTVSVERTTPWNEIDSFSFGRGAVSSVSLAAVLGYVPRTTYVPVEVGDGFVSLRIDDIKRKVAG